MHANCHCVDCFTFNVHSQGTILSLVLVGFLVTIFQVQEFNVEKDLRIRKEAV
jgi:hypothetical protein